VTHEYKAGVPTTNCYPSLGWI